MARLVELVPQGQEVTEVAGGVEFAVYVERRELVRLRAALPALRVAPVEPGWEHAWRRFHRPVVVGPLWIGPPWERPPADRLPVVVDPGRAFGTGAHPTTRLCLDLLAEVERGSLLDVGCGSGVLAIAAARLGYAPVVAVDVDEAAVEAARENARRNAVAIGVRRADALVGELPATDVVVANIDRAAGETLGRVLRCSCLVLSGYLAGERPVVPGFRRRVRRTAAGWAAEAYTRE